MSPETRAFLDSIRSAEDPTADDERRVLRAVQASLAAGAAIAVGAEATKLGKLLASLLTGGKLVGLAIFVLAVSGDGAGRVAPAAPIRSVAAALPARIPRPAFASRPILHAPEVSSSAALAAAPPARPERRERAPSLEDELALLTRVQQALQRGEGDAALRMLQAHRTDDRQLLAERSAARILALCAAGRANEARQAAAAFAAEHAGSVQQLALSRSCVARD
jgi:hypothetical protein